MFRGLRWQAALAGVAVTGALACRADKPVPRKLDETPAARTLLDQARKLLGPVLEPGTTPLYRREGDRFFAEVREDPAGVGRHARVLFPWLASSPASIIDAASGATVDVSLPFDDEVTAALSKGLAVYPKAGLIRRPNPEGFDDYILEQRAGEPQLAYQLQLGKGVTGLRLYAGQLELLDGGGAPRLRLSHEAVTDANGARHLVTIAVTDCAKDSNPRAPWGAPVTVPGARVCTVTLTWDAIPPKAYPIAIEAHWSTTGSMSRPREDFRALSIGRRVIVAGGITDTHKATAAVELFDPASGTWAATEEMHDARAAFTLTDLGDGRVLAIGGRSGLDVSSALATAETYDLAAGAWTPTGQPMRGPRLGHTATPLTHGSILIAGGEDSHGTALASTLLYTPRLDRWDLLLPMLSPRAGHAAVRLPDGRVLATGGEADTALATSEIFSPSTLRWEPAASLGIARSNLALAMLRDGFTAVAIGGRTGAMPTPNVEWFSIRDNTWTAGTPLEQARDAPILNLLGDGTLVVTGGAGEVPAASTEVGSSTAREWNTAATLAVPRTHHEAVILSDGTLLVIGGRGPDGPTNSAEIVSVPVSCTHAQDCPTGFCVDGYCCSSACDEGPCDRCDLIGQQGICGLAPEGEDGDPSCKPFTCSGLSVMCNTSCIDDSGCTGGNFCQHGDCLPTFFDGLVCTRSGQCESGYCTRDHVCSHPSDEAVPHPEQAKSAPAHKAPLRARGARCEAGTECGSAFCVSGLCCDSACDDPCARCDAPGFEGTCAPREPGAESQCEGLRCDGTSVTCPHLCTMDVDCVDGDTCVSGTCRSLCDVVGSECVSGL